MTDVTQTDIVAGSTPAPARSEHLFSPVVDFLMLGGGSLIACAAIVLLLPKGLPSAQQLAIISIVMIAINQPHFANSYQMFYDNFHEKAFGAAYSRNLRLRYIFAGVVVPSALLLFLVAASLSGNALALGLGANLMFLTVGWHYVKQGYGILVLDSVQKRVFFSDTAKTIFRVNGYVCWSVSWIGLNHALWQSKSYIGIPYYTFPIPDPIYYASIALAVVTSSASVVMLVQRWRQAPGRLPWNGIVAYIAALYLWLIFFEINPLVAAIIPTFHSLQYLAVVWRYQLNRRVDKPEQSFSFFVLAGVLLGFLGFTALPWVMANMLPYDKTLLGPTLFLFACYVFINVHHYFLDNVMWRRENPEMKYVFGRK